MSHQEAEVLAPPAPNPQLGAEVASELRAEVVRHGETGAVGFSAGDVFSEAERVWTPDRKAQVAGFLGVDPNLPEFQGLLLIAAAYGLNPFLGEIWLIEVDKRAKVNGQWQTVGKEYSATIGRDGLLSRARRDPSYLGHKSGVVCENDEFYVEQGAGFMDPPVIRHVIKSASKNQRGRVLAAYSLVGMRNRPYTFYLADVLEHGKMKTDKNTGAKSWSGAWEYTQAMLLKSAVSYAHRLALGITGVVPIDELSPEARSRMVTGEANDAPKVASRDLTDLWAEVENLVGREMRDRLADAMLDWQDARVEMTLVGQDAEGLHRLADRIAAHAAVVEAEVIPNDTEDDDEGKPSEDPGATPLEEKEDPPAEKGPLTSQADLAGHLDDLKSRAAFAKDEQEEQAIAAEIAATEAKLRAFDE